MSRELELVQRFPEAEWWKPIPLRVIGKCSGFACRFCIAMYGYKPAENQMPGFSEKFDDVVTHIHEKHRPVI
jgi:hypothetical protein